MSFGVCTGLLEIHEKPPMAGECILSKDGTALFFFSCGEWDLTAMLNVLACFYCASISTYWQAQVMRENTPLIWSECWALCYKKNFQSNFRVQKISLVYSQEALTPSFSLNKILSKIMLSFFFHAVHSFVFIYLECLNQDRRFLNVLLNSRKRLQLWRKYSKTETVYFDLFLFYSEVRRQTGGVLGLFRWFATDWLHDLPVSGSNSPPWTRRRVSKKKSNSHCLAEIVSQCPFLSFRRYLPPQSSGSWFSTIWRTGIRKTSYILCAVTQPSTYAALQSFVHSYICTHIYIF